ncbi:Eukaryotic translation initiation factor 2D [Thoreauomyces humboldtii]|nr:Eukaryotic translation initiation factor 2D [Thoreauomyces humboldtii]
MFKKAFHTKPQSQVRSSDRRKLRSELIAAYPNASESLVADLLPTDTGRDVTQAKLVAHSGAQWTLYSVDGQPVLFRDLDGRLVPTVYSLWKIPGMLPLVHTHGPVLQKLFDGADLMLPGVVVPPQGFGHFQYGDVAAIAVRGNPLPMAVGTMAVSAADIGKNSELRGKAVHVLHTFGDKLWEHGDRSEPPEMEEMDEILESALLTALKVRLPNDPKTLPMTSSELYSAYILPSRPRGTLLDIKYSSFKKLGKFLKAMEKRGLIKLKERGGETLLVSVNRQHPHIVEFDAPKKLAGDEKLQKEGLAGLVGAPAETGGNAVGTQGSGAAKLTGPVSVIELYKPLQKELPLFQHVEHSKNSFYTLADLRNLINDYATLHSLVDRSNPRMIKIDPHLADSLLKREEYTTIDYLPRDVLVQRLVDRMQAFHELKAPGLTEGEIRKGVPKPIVIHLEKRGGNKCITRIVGMEAFGIGADQLAACLKIRCASSTSVTPIPGKTTTVFHEVMVQGTKSKDVCAVLEKEFGIPFTGSGTSRFVEVTQKAAKKGGK